MLPLSRSICAHEARCTLMDSCSRLHLALLPVSVAVPSTPCRSSPLAEPVALLISARLLGCHLGFRPDGRAHQRVAVEQATTALIVARRLAEA